MALPLLNTISIPNKRSITITGINHHFLRSRRYFQKSLKKSIVIFISLVLQLSVIYNQSNLSSSFALLIQFKLFFPLIGITPLRLIFFLE